MELEFDCVYNIRSLDDLLYMVIYKSWGEVIIEYKRNSFAVELL